ncbi:MAG: hypothetical protein JWM53_55 [bacterium]|nr:hypothetical protein [bacterium]
MLRWILVGIVLGASACSSTPTDSPACENVASQVQRLTSTSRSCAVDSDCVLYVQTACGLDGECGMAVNASAKLQLDRLITEFVTTCPNLSTSCGRCSSPPTAARCQANVCRCDNGC